jgi:hypothetical protein
MPKLKEPTDTWSGAGQPDVIGQWGKMRLVRYQARGPRRHPVPVLIVSPLLAKPYVLDLAPGLSLVDHLVERGLELFLTCGSGANSCLAHGTRATWSASDWSAAGSTTSCRFQGRRTASSSRTWSRPTSSCAVNS